MSGDLDTKVSWEDGSDDSWDHIIDISGDEDPKTLEDLKAYVFAKISEQRKKDIDELKLQLDILDSQ